MRCPRGRIDHRAFRYLGDFLLAVLGAVMQLQVTLNGIHHLIARIYAKLAAVFATAGHEHQRVSVLPENVNTLAGLAELTRGVRQADDWHCRHGRTSCSSVLTSVCGDAMARQPSPHQPPQ